MPSLLFAEETGKRVVISTGTKTLQDQIMNQDLPLLSDRFDVQATVMKGLANYLCIRRYEEFRSSAARRRGYHRRSLR